MRKVGRRSSLGVELLLSAVVDEKATSSCSHVVVFLLSSDHLEVEQVALKLPVAGGRVPS